MNDQEQPSATPDTFSDRRWYAIYVRRRTFSEWLAWVIWLLGLIILFEYAVTSFQEHETQAGVLAAAILVSVLFAGVIVETVKSIEIRDRSVESQPDDEDH